MSEHDDFPLDGGAELKIEMLGVEAAGRLADAVEEEGRPISTDERLLIQDVTVAAFMRLHNAVANLGTRAAELANEGDVLGAISIMGGEENARQLIRDEEVDALVEQLGNAPDTIPEEFE